MGNLVGVTLLRLIVCSCSAVYCTVCGVSDGSNLEIFLEMLNDDEIILVVSHDEASTKYVTAS